MEFFNKIKKNINNVINSNKQRPYPFLIIFLILIIFTTISYFLYNQNIKQFLDKKFVLNREFINKQNDNTDNNVTVIYFYTEWCPYCKKSRPEWESFKELVQMNSFSNNVEFQEVDCDNDPDLANKYKIEGYPTIKLLYRGEVYDYDAKLESKTLLHYLQSIIQ